MYYAFTPACGLPDSQYGIANGANAALGRLPPREDGTRHWTKISGGPTWGQCPTGYPTFEEAANFVSKALKRTGSGRSFSTWF